MCQQLYIILFYHLQRQHESVELENIFLKRSICLIEVLYYKVNLNSDNKIFLHVKLKNWKCWHVYLKISMQLQGSLTCKNILLPEFKLTL